MLVKFPLENLDISHVIQGQPKSTLNLKSIVVHQGKSIFEGHFISYGLSDASWLKFDDSYVSKATLSEVTAAQAYLLFYSRNTS